jgi:ubiquinone/menaquinone biosynthesis C-methylase UbiE
MLPRRVGKLGLLVSLVELAAGGRPATPLRAGAETHLDCGKLGCQTAAVPAHRDVAAFHERALGYEQGWLGRLHHDIADRTADLALSAQPAPRRVLDVGCGTGYLLRLLARRCPPETELAGIDPAPAMVATARQAAGGQRLRFSVAAAERIPYTSAAFDLVVSTTSFDHWQDQQAGLRECARMLAPGGHLVLVDVFSPLLRPTLLGGRRAKARTKRRASLLLTTAGFTGLAWHDIYASVIKGATATT